MSNPRKSYIGCWWCMLITIGILIAALLTSCKSTEYIEVPVVHTDTVYQSKLVHDSIYQHDSITIREKGDSIWIERWHTKYVLQELHDTLIQHVCDSIPYPVDRPVPVPAELSWWQTTMIYLGHVLLCFICLLVIIKIVKLKFRL